MLQFEIDLLQNISNMPNKKFKKVNLISLRKQLGWTQAEFALVLKIPRIVYTALENKTRGANAELLEKIRYIELSAEKMAKRGILKRSVNPPLADNEIIALREKVTSLELSIHDMQKRFDKLKQYVFIVHHRNNQLASQSLLLKQMKAPADVLAGLNAIAFKEKDKRGYYSLEKLYQMEAKIAAKKAECALLKKKLSSLPKKTAGK